MKTHLHLAALQLRLRGVPPAAAMAAVRGLGPALAQQLAAGPAAPPPLPANPAAAAVRRVVAARAAAALRPHLPRPS